MTNRLFLIDGHGLCYRAFYAVKALTNSKGQPTNAVFGFCNMLHKIIKSHQPTHMAVCFDISKATLRQEAYAEYKANRQSMPDELRVQIPVIRKIIEAYHIPMIELEGYEADDVMGTLAKRFTNKDTQAIIVTEDKDMGQIVGGPIVLFSPRLDKIVETADVEEKFGVRPDQIVDYIGLAGDASDNIPGVDGVGEVTAVKLLKEYGTIEGIYQSIDGMKASKLKEKLIAGKEAALLSKQLATLHVDLPLTIRLDELKVQPFNVEELAKIYKDLEFKRFLDDLTPGKLPITEAPVDLVRVCKGKNERGQSILIVMDTKSCLKDGLITQDDVAKTPIFDVALADYVLSGGQGQYDLNQGRVSDEAMQALYDVQQRLVKEQGLEQLLNDIELPLAQVLYEIEKDGVVVDKEVLAELSSICETKIHELENKLYELAEIKFNLNSPKQLSEILFEKLKLPVIKKTKTGYSTDEEVLSRLASQHPLPAMILEYRTLAKLKSTYIDALPLLINPTTGRIHTTFNQTGAETGRLSSTNPNLQNIPIRTELGRQIRRAFVPYAKDDILLAVDYSQIELRVLAHLCKDVNLSKAFAEDQDIHRYTASLMFDIPQDQVEESMRYAAKRVNFGIIYGISAFGLAKDLEVPNAKAQEFIERYFLRYPKVREFMDQEIQKARDLGYVTTMFGRRRYLPQIHNSNQGLRQFAERQAINTPVQGTAADMIKLAMVHVDKAMHEQKLKSTMLMTVHDELVFNVPPKEVKTMIDLVKTTMENVLTLDVPLKASVKTGPNWLEMNKV